MSAELKNSSVPSFPAPLHRKPDKVRKTRRFTMCGRGCVHCPTRKFSVVTKVVDAAKLMLSGAVKKGSVFLVDELEVPGCSLKTH